MRAAARPGRAASALQVRRSRLTRAAGRGLARAPGPGRRRAGRARGRARSAAPRPRGCRARPGPPGPAPGRFPVSASPRAVGPIGVLSYHRFGFFAQGSRPGAAIRPYLARLGGSLVVFLLISAFLLYRPFVAAHARDKPRPSVRAYGWR